MDTLYIIRNVELRPTHVAGVHVSHNFLKTLDSGLRRSTLSSTLRLRPEGRLSTGRNDKK